MRAEGTTDTVPGESGAESRGLCDRGRCEMTQNIPAPHTAPTMNDQIPTIPALGRRIRALCDVFDELDQRNAASQSRTPAAVRALHAMQDQIDEERLALSRLILALRAETLQDAAVQLAHAFYSIASWDAELPPSELNDRTDQMQRVLASTLVVVAKAANISLDETGWKDLVTDVYTFIPCQEAL